MKESKLTIKQIASMSEVVAEYMEHECRIMHDRLFILGKPNSIIRGWSLFHSSWDWIHEVWEKVQEEKLQDSVHTIFTYLDCAGGVAYGTKEEALIALYKTIEIINQKKVNASTNIKVGASLESS